MTHNWILRNIIYYAAFFSVGDLFDEGLWCSEKEFAYYVNRFNDLFRVPAGSQLFVVAGNHDVGFHYG